MGEVAASGGYYISCGADSVFAEPNTITGSIGVFAVIPNMENFFKDKLGVTFDGVSTAPHAGAVNVIASRCGKNLCPIQKPRGHRS